MEVSPDLGGRGTLEVVPMVGGRSELRKGLDLGAPLASVGKCLNMLYDRIYITVPCK